MAMPCRGACAVDDEEIDGLPILSMEEASLTGMSESLVDYSVVRVDPRVAGAAADREGRLKLPIDGEERDLILSPAHIVAKSARASCGIYDAVSDRHFEGYVDGVDDSLARVSFNDKGIVAWVKINDLQWIVEPASKHNASIESSMQVVYRADLNPSSARVVDAWALYESISEDIESEEIKVGDERESNTFDVDSSSDGGEILTANSTTEYEEVVQTEAMSITPVSEWSQELRYRVLRVLAATDNQFRQNYDNSDIEDYINIVAGWYTLSGIWVCLSQAPLSWNHDNSGETDELIYLERFDLWIENSYGSLTGFDVAVLFAGRSFSPAGGGTVYGYSYMRGAGDTGVKYSGLPYPDDRSPWGRTLVSVVTSMTSDEHCRLLAHELGHSFNAWHQYAEASPSTIMGTWPHYYPWFSDGDPDRNLNNEQRVRNWAAVNLHVVEWYDEGESYGDHPEHYLLMTDLRVWVRDIPGPTDKVLNVFFTLTNYYPSNRVRYIDLDYINSHLQNPSGSATYWFGHDWNVRIYRGSHYHYSSEGPSNVAMSSYGQWKAMAGYRVTIGSTVYAEYSDSPVYVNRYYVLAEVATPYTYMEYPGFLQVQATYNAVDMACWTFYVLSLYDDEAHVGQTFDVYWGAFNTLETVYRPDGQTFQLYVACQEPNYGTWKDFGHTSVRDWVGRPTADENLADYGNPGGGNSMFLKTSQVLTKTGTWRVIPDMYSSTWLAWYGAEVHLEVVS